MTFASFGDASFASESLMKAQQGLFVAVAVCAKELGETLRRLVRPTSIAEPYAVSSSLGYNQRGESRIQISNYLKPAPQAYTTWRTRWRPQIARSGE